MKPSFFERLTGTVSLRERPTEIDEDLTVETAREESGAGWGQGEPLEGELAIDVYQTDDSIFIQAMVAGVAPENLSVSATRDMVTIKGRREAPKGIAPDNYFYQELYWGAFSRTILLPAEIEAEEIEAVERRGLLTLKLPKIDKGRIQNVKIKSV